MPAEAYKDSEDDWEEKLRMNAAFDDPFQDTTMNSSASAWDRYSLSINV